MKIDRNNYEAYLMDYLDGKLDALAVSELLKFLDENPDIKEEFEGLQSVPALEQETVFLDKSSLRKPAYDEVKKNYEDLLIGKLENDLSLAQHQELNKAIILYPELKQDEALFKQTKLQADLKVVFPNKSALKKRERVLLLNNTLLRVAAILLVLALGWWMLKPLSNTNQGQVADVNSTNQTTAKKKSQPQTTTTAEKPLQHEQVDQTQSQTQHQIQPLKDDKQSTVAQEQAKAPQYMAQIASRFFGTSESDKKEITKPYMQKVNTQLAYQPEQINKEAEFPKLSELVYQRIEQQKDKVVKEKNKPENMNEPKPQDAGWVLVRLFNKVTGADVKVTRTYDANGERKGYEIAANNFEFSTSK